MIHREKKKGCVLREIGGKTSRCVVREAGNGTKMKINKTARRMKDDTRSREQHGASL
jgi:hypothetical protein